MRPFSMKKLHNKIDKSTDGLSYGFHDPTTWLDTGCLALNYLMSGRFDGGVALEGKLTMFAGDSGSGKSYIVSANIIKDCQAKGVFPVLIDTENSLDKSWLAALGVDTSPDALEIIKLATVDAAAKLMNDVLTLYLEQNGAVPYEQRPPMVFIIDSVGMLITPTMEKQFEAGDMKGDMGIKAKQVTQMIRVILSKIGNQRIGLLITNHVFDSQDQYKPDQIAGGKMLEFATSCIVQMNKFLLKEDEFGADLKGGKVSGIRSTAVVRKSRYAKPFEKIKIDIPYDKGMNKFSGCFDLFQGKGLLITEGQSYTYTSRVTGEVKKLKKKELISGGMYDLIISEHELWENEDSNSIGFGETVAPDEDDEDA